MRTSSAAIIILSAALITISLVVLAYQLIYIEDVRTIPASATLNEGNIAGFNVALDQLTFGTISYESTSHRGFFITHQRSYPLKVHIRTEGNISPYLSIVPTDFVLQPGERRRVQASITFPQGSAVGNYSGQVTVRLTKNI